MRKSSSCLNRPAANAERHLISRCRSALIGSAFIGARLATAIVTYVVADAGYSNGEQVAQCEAAGMMPFVPVMGTVNNQGDGTLFGQPIPL